MSPGINIFKNQNQKYFIDPCGKIACVSAVRSIIIKETGSAKFDALGKILGGAPFHRSQFHNQFSYTHTETACMYWRFYFF